MLLRILSLSLLCVAALLARGPNIVVIMADDMGYGDVRALNAQSKIPTPNLDRLAGQGMTFLDAHTPSAVCTPTRYGLLTGRYAWRTRLKSGVLNGYGEPLIAKDRETIGSFLRARGYATGVVGKWHLGLGFAKTGPDAFDFSKPISDGPHTHGFDFSYVIPASLDFPPYVYIRDGKITKFPLVEQEAIKFPRFMRKGERAPDLDPVKVLDTLVREASGFIARQSKEAKPFLLYMPLTAPHKPAWPHKRFRGKTKLGPYGDFIVQVDSSVGDVLKAIDDAGIADNTLVIYTSDNGSYMYRLSGLDEKDHVDDESIQSYRSGNHTSNYVFRGTKADIWEAGHHVPFFARWPGEIEPGSEHSEPICLTDIFATLAEVTGADLPHDAAEDSFSLLPLMRGGTWTTQRAPVIHHSGSGTFAIRDGKWKLVAGNGSGGREEPKGKPFERPYQLFDLETDGSERRNVIGENPIVASRLEAELEGIRSKGRSR
jgi:arylsulfatase A